MRTVVGVNSPQARKLWSANLAVDVPKVPYMDERNSNYPMTGSNGAKGQAPSRQVADGDGVLPSVGGRKTWRDLGLPERLPVIWPAPIRLPKATTLAAQVEQFYAATRSTGFVERAITRPDGTRDVIYSEVVTPEGLDNVYLTEQFVRHVVGHINQHREQFVNHVLPTLQNPSEVWRQWSRAKGGRMNCDQLFLARFKDIGSLLVVREMPKEGSLAWTFYRVSNKQANRRRAGELTYRKIEE